MLKTTTFAPSAMRFLRQKRPQKGLAGGKRRIFWGVRTGGNPPRFPCYHWIAMRFFFNEKKAAQAAAYFVQLHSGSIDLMVLIKLLYLADRRSLIEVGSPVTGDRMVSMPHGPVLSQIYDLAKWPGGLTGVWESYITERRGNQVGLVEAAPDIGELSSYELGLLARIHRDFGHLSALQLRAMTHDLAEYQDPAGSSLEIDPQTILRNAGRTPEEIREIAADAEEDFILGKILTLNV